MGKKDVIIAKKKHALQRKAIAESKKSDHAFRLHVKFTKKHAATTILHAKWTKKSEAAAKKVTLSKEVAVNAMESAQCVIKDKRSGCTKWKKTGHCKTASFKAWMVTHCTESCGFSCTDLHELAMGIVKVANAKKRKRARKYEKGHVQYRKRMVDLKCYQYEKQWAKKAAKKGKAKGKKAGKKAKKGKKGKKAKKKKLEEEEEEFQEEGSYD